MRLPTCFAVVVLSAVALVLPACGGGETFRIDDQNISVESTALPLTLSGETVNHVIPLRGNCSGPYVMAVIAGALPPGMFLDNATRSIQGVALQTGVFHFVIQIDATGCTPFATTTASFHWTITTGPVKIVLCEPDIIPIASYNPPNSVIYNDVDGLATTVYNAFSVFDFTVAGGTPPYSLDVIDDPADPNDGALPLGISIPPNSTSFVGSPQEVRPGGQTFRITLQATDALNQTGVRKFQWKIDTPPIVIATTTLVGGKCGTNYAEIVQVAGGVPPFEFEQTTTLGVNGTIVWQSPLAPTINGGAILVDVTTGRANNKVTAANYPAAAAVGPYVGITPEGVVLRETTGTFSGAPRRTGAFTFYIHVFSTLVPNEFGQHAWQPYTVTFANSEPPNVPAPAFSYGSLGTWTLEGGLALLVAPPYSTIPEFEVGVPYNPDGGAAGVSMIAQGGVPKDGLNDAPHFSQVTVNALEVPGTYDWTVNWDADAVGAPNPPTGIVLAPTTGVITVPNPNVLIGRGRTNLSFTTKDQQLPTGNQHTITGRAAYSIGPDKVIITDSPTSNASTQVNLTFNDYVMTVKVLRPFSSGMVVTTLANTDLSLTTALPSGLVAGTTLATLLTTIDLCRVTVNPTGYWDDVYGLNVTGARPGQHSDPNRHYGYYNPNWGSGTSPLSQQPSSTALALPNAPTAVGTPATGVYKDGGKLYAFSGTNKFGIMIVRSDSSICIPCAFNTSTSGFSAFGDGMLTPYAASQFSMLRTVQMAVSPDGRFGALKLKLSTLNGHNGLLDTANNTRIVLISLTGETPFSGAQFKVITTGSSGGQITGGFYQYANSLCLTNNHLYYLCGNHASYLAACKEHLIYRYTITGGAAGGALLAPNAFPRWINTTGSISNMMQTPFQRYDNPSYLSSVNTGFNPTTFATLELPQDEMYEHDGWNGVENGLAPVPFRVSKDGAACVILAGIEPNSTSSVNCMNHDVWVDYNGTLRLLSSTPRHSPGGGGRGYSLTRGTSQYYNWGFRQGPTTRLEISDNATKVAVVVNRMNSTVTIAGTNWYAWRDDIVAYTTTTNWASVSQIQVTGTESATAALFGGTHLWRFGALVFTKDNAGLIFWGGRSAQGSAGSTVNERATCYTGTFYSYEFSTGVLKSILPTSDGGSDAGIATYTTSSVVNPTGPTTTTLQAHGRVRPTGGFISKNREFFYVMAQGPLSTTSQTQAQLVGINIRSLNTSASINGKNDGLGFKVLGQTDRRGFCWGYQYYYIYYSIEYRHYAPAGANGMGYQVMAKNTGLVFNGSQYMANGPTIDTTSTTVTFGAGSTIASYWGDYGMYGGQIEGFAADVGGNVQRLTTVGLTPVDTTVIRAIHFIDTTPDGNAIAFVYDTGGNPRNMAGETLGYMKINWNLATGTASYRNPQLHLPSPNGRVSDAISHDSTGNKLYYAFGSSNENSKVLTEMRFVQSISAAPDTVSTRTLPTASNYNVLHSGR